ncbi:MAG: hypothetical protein K2L88_06890, partial [Clostridiales bacterium]|nr:hypothetical protein [Clostridiales bacterium]
MIDSDDEYKLDFLEKTIPFIVDNNLDIAMVGNDFIDAVSGQITRKRVLPQPLILDTPSMFAEYFPVYHQFARTMWGKLFTGKAVKQTPTSNNCSHVVWTDMAYGGDTVFVFTALRHSMRVGIYPETFYKYYVSPKSSSYNWNFDRFESDQILNDDAEDYLKRFGPISQQNRGFLCRVYANAVSDSLNVLYSAQGMTAEDKLKELRKVVDYHGTSDMLTLNYPAVEQCKRNIFNLALNFGLKLKEENDDFKAALALICPNCAPFVSMNEIELYAREGTLQNALFNDNLTELVKQLLSLISKGAYTKQFDLFAIVYRLSANRGLAEEISDHNFIKKYGDIYFMLWQKQYVQALDRTPEILLKEQSLDETFLQVHLTLAAMLESVDEFILGKVKLAAYYCDQKQIEKCAVVLDDLEDMGVEDNDEI